MRLTPEFESTLRRYVAGELDEELRAELEELLVTDPEAFEALGVVEDELLEEHLEAEDSARTAGFDQAFLAPPERRQQLRLTRALKERAQAEAARRVDDGQPTPADALAAARAPSWVERLLGALRPPRQPAWVAVAAALALSLSANVWLANRRPAQLAPSPNIWLASRRPTQQAPSPSALPELVLAPGLLRAAGTLPRIAVPPDATVVRLLCDVPGQEYPSYRAAVVNEDGEEVWAASRLRAETIAGRSVLALLVPAAVLTRGDYQVTLSGITPAGGREALSSSPLRVTTP
jgi:hypothetical protein